jgi:hypothetical protein
LTMPKQHIESYTTKEALPAYDAIRYSVKPFLCLHLLRPAAVVENAYQTISM